MPQNSFCSPKTRLNFPSFPWLMRARYGLRGAPPFLFYFRLIITPSCLRSLHSRVRRAFTSVEMKILKANAGPLTNFEVYDFLRKRGASTAERVMLTKLRPSELQVFDYLVKTPACNQTRESIIEFMEKCKEYDLAKAEVVNVTNIRPVESVEALPCIEYCTKRMDDRLEAFQTMVNTVLPPHPYPRASDEEAGADDSADQEIPEEEMDAS